MEEENNRSLVGGMDGGSSKPEEGDGGGGNQEAKFDENDEEKRVSEADCSDCTAEKTFSGERGESRSSRFETLTSARVPGIDFDSYSQESSNFLLEVPVVYSLQPLQSAENWKDEIRVINKELVKDFAGQPAEVEIQTQLQSQSVANGNNHCLTVQDKQNSLDPKPLSAVPMLKAPDGYNWRKYGQKKVKSPEGFRSYYRCTYSDCHAKKIECCDQSNRAIQTVYRSHHNHDPPQKVNCARESKHSLVIESVNGTHETVHSGRGLNDSVPSMPKESFVAIDRISDTKQQDSCGSDETTEINIKEYVEGHEYKRRQKRSSTGELDSHYKNGKKAKYVVHAPGDECLSSDGYRWRKYGQKMVKGNPHPRNYYRCTSAGCPVRKHIERDVDNAGDAVVITYKGVHDHDMPVLRKRDGPRNISAAAVTADTLPIHKTEPHQSQSHQSADKESDSLGETLNPGGEKSLESVRTLLSIGFEIKPS